MPGIGPDRLGIADSFVHGLRGNTTNLAQDGINVADNFVNRLLLRSAPRPWTRSASSMLDRRDRYDVGFGAAQVNIRTQRASNDFHGSLFSFQRTMR